MGGHVRNQRMTRGNDGAWTVGLRDGGRFVAWSARAPRAATVGGVAAPFAWDAVSGLLSVTVAGTQALALTIVPG